MLKTFSLKHLEITIAYKKTWRKEFEARKENNTTNEGKRRTKSQNFRAQKKGKKHKKRQSMDKDETTENDIQEVILIEDDESPVMSPVVLPPEFFN